MKIIHVDQKNTRIPCPGAENMTFDQILQYLANLGFKVVRKKIEGDTLYFTTGALLNIDGK